MKLFIAIALFALALAAAGCSETPATSSNSTTHELEIVPNAINVGQFQTFSIKARMTNTALSDVNVVFFFGDGTDSVLRRAGTDATHFYQEIGTFTITVKAYDIFSDALLATKTVTANVNAGIHTVSITPHVIDTTSESDDFGLLPSFAFIGSSNLPLQNAHFIFDYGDGKIDTSADANPSHRYDLPGTYKVRMSVRDVKWNFWGADSATVTVRLPQLTLSMLKDAKRVSIAFGVDNTTPVYSAPNFENPFIIGMLFVNDSISSSSWSGNSFSLRIETHTSLTDWNDSGHVIYTIKGNLSSDLSKVEQVVVYGEDTVGTSRKRRVGYTLSNLSYFAINNDVIVFKIENRPLSDFSSSVLFESNSSFDSRIGFPDYNQIKDRIVGYQRKNPYAFVIFSRQ